MTDYTPVNPRHYTEGELKQAIEIIEALHSQCVNGSIDEHAAPALLIAIDCISDVLREMQP